MPTKEEIENVGESPCQICGIQNYTWFAPSEIWNRVMRNPDRETYVCVNCFFMRAREKGVEPKLAWVVSEESL